MSFFITFITVIQRTSPLFNFWVVDIIELSKNLKTAFYAYIIIVISFNAMMINVIYIVYKKM